MRDAGQTVILQTEDLQKLVSGLHRQFFDQQEVALIYFLGEVFPGSNAFSLATMAVFELVDEEADGVFQLPLRVGTSGLILPDELMLYEVEVSARRNHQGEEQVF